MASKYQNGKIYKISNLNNDDIYIGSTVNLLKARFTQHQCLFRLYLDGKTNYTTSFKLFQDHGKDNCKIELIKVFPCNSKKRIRS